jgi:hypothetical protein
MHANAIAGANRAAKREYDRSVPEVPEVAVVVPTWNSEGFISDCLASISAQSLAHEVLVVDNGSHDRTVERAKSMGATVLRLQRNEGFAVAVNAGVRAVDAAFVFVLNVDTRLDEGCLRALADVLTAEPAYLGAQPRILQADTDPPRIYSAGQWLLPDGRAFEEGAGVEDGEEFDRPKEVFGVCGAASLFRRGPFLDLGGYDERYFAFYEDVELNIRARLAGWRFRYVADARLWHVGRAAWQSSAVRPAAFNARLVARNRLMTDIRYLPARHAAKVLRAEAGSVARSIGRRTFRATVRGKAEALRAAPRLMRERRGRMTPDMAKCLEQSFRAEEVVERHWATPVPS